MNSQQAEWLKAAEINAKNVLHAIGKIREFESDPVLPDPTGQTSNPTAVDRVIRKKADVLIPQGYDSGHYLGSLSGDNDPGHNLPLPPGTLWTDGAPYYKVVAPKPIEVVQPLPNTNVSSSPIDIRQESDTDWLSAGWLSNVEQFVREDAQSENGTSVFILYDVPDRDNGNYSAGGAETINRYAEVVQAVSRGIADDLAIVVIEPDALGLLSGLPEDRQSLRLSCIALAVQTLKENMNTRSYVDASMWVPAHEMADRLKAVGAEGFSLNVSGWEASAECYRYGDELAELTGLHYIIDSSRNGKGNPHKPAWANVTDTMVGEPATTKTGSRYCDALIHAKIAGESDGSKINGWDGDGQPNRNDIPRAGMYWPEFKEAITTGAWGPFKRKYKV